MNKDVLGLEQAWNLELILPAIGSGPIKKSGTHHTNVEPWHTAEASRLPALFFFSFLLFSFWQSWRFSLWHELNAWPICVVLRNISAVTCYLKRCVTLLPFYLGSLFLLVVIKIGKGLLSKTGVFSSTLVMTGYSVLKVSDTWIHKTRRKNFIKYRNNI